MSRRYTKVAREALGNRGFVAHCRDLIESPAWLTMPVNTKRFIEFLELEHLRHGGRENGELLAPYNQLMAFGISRRLIPATISDAVTRGLVEVTHRGRSHHFGRKVDPSRYRLTYLQWILRGATGPDWIPPTNDWRAYRPPPKPARRRHPKLWLVITND